MESLEPLETNKCLSGATVPLLTGSVSTRSTVVQRVQVSTWTMFNVLLAIHRTKRWASDWWSCLHLACCERNKKLDPSLTQALKQTLRNLNHMLRSNLILQRTLYLIFIYITRRIQYGKKSVHRSRFSSAGSRTDSGHVSESQNDQHRAQTHAEPPHTAWISNALSIQNKTAQTTNSYFGL